MLARGKSVPRRKRASSSAYPRLQSSPRQQASFTSSQEIIFQRSADVPGSSELPSLAAFPFELEAMPAAVRLGMLSRQVGARKTVQDQSRTLLGMIFSGSTVQSVAGVLVFEWRRCRIRILFCCLMFGSQWGRGRQVGTAKVTTKLLAGILCRHYWASLPSCQGTYPFQHSRVLAQVRSTCSTCDPTSQASSIHQLTAR